MTETETFPAAAVPQDPASLEGAREALVDALSARGLSFTLDREWGTVTVGGCTVAVWATCCPYAVYGEGDWLPRRQFDGLPALLQFLEEGLCRAA